MRPFYYLLIAIIFTFCFLPKADAGWGKKFSGEHEVDDLAFAVKSAFMIESADAQQIMGVRFIFRNLTETRKLDVTEPFVYELKDEFGNTYRRLPTPDHYSVVNVQPQNYPSIYPKEAVEEVIFFEPPINRSHYLTLTVNAHNIGLKKDINLMISSGKIKGIAKAVSDAGRSGQDEAEETIEPLKYSRVFILSPGNGAEVKPGQRLPVEVSFEDSNLKPHVIMVIIPSYVLEDHDASGKYDLIVPQDQKGSFSLVVIAKWTDGEREELTSDSVLLNVVDPALL